MTPAHSVPHTTPPPSTTATPQSINNELFPSPSSQSTQRFGPHNFDDLEFSLNQMSQYRDLLSRTQNPEYNEILSNSVDLTNPSTVDDTKAAYLYHHIRLLRNVLQSDKIISHP
mmetsp:Transcript_6272/g.23578  ORF Transcript_6272/g.23578 Transcript_6272/m.23578 type:complete len:114 (-) Transcript_6272:1247-1588(-)